MSIAKIRYIGLPNCVKLSNGTVDVIATTAVGPRILFYGPSEGENVLALHPDASRATALGIWKPYGGHRLWVWPEFFPATYAPDNRPIECAAESDLSVRLHRREDDAGIEKQIRVTLSPTGSKVRLEQTVTSRNLWPVDIAPWALTIVKPGTSIIPRTPFQSHEDHVAVTQPLALCAYTNLQDPRFTLGLKYILLRADPSRADAQKIGLRNKQDWCAHLAKDMLFVKRFTHDELASYPDYEVNTELFTRAGFQELELLGPHRVVQPGDSLTLVEEWHLFEDVHVADTTDLDALDAAITPKIQTLF